MYLCWKAASKTHKTRPPLLRLNKQITQTFTNTVRYAQNAAQSLR